MADASLIDWLADRAHEVLGTELTLDAVLAGATGWMVDTVDLDGGLTGVSVWAPGRQWYLQSDDESAVIALAQSVGSAGDDWPAKVMTSATVKVSLRPWLLALRGPRSIAREHNLVAMVCRIPCGPGDGRWATPADREALERYQLAYNAERSTSLHSDWNTLLSRHAVAVLEDDGRVVAAVRRTADTIYYATVANIWTAPTCRRQGFAARLMAFLIDAILAERPAVHILVDEDNGAAMALYRSLGFIEVGRAYMAYLA